MRVGDQNTMPGYGSRIQLAARGGAGAGGGGVAPTISNNSVISTAPGNSTALVFASNVTSGNLGVIALSASASPTFSPAFAVGNYSKTAGTSTIGTITLDILASRTYAAGVNTNYAAIISFPITGSGSLTITFAGSNPVVTYSFMRGVEVSSVDVSGTRVNATSKDETTTGTTAAPGSIATGGAGIIFGILNPGDPFGTQTMSTPTNYTLLGESEDDSASNYSFVYRSTTTNITDGPSWTIGTSSSLVAGDVAYKSSTP